jgi:hypothetical protein
MGIVTIPTSKINSVGSLDLSHNFGIELNRSIPGHSSESDAFKT